MSPAVSLRLYYLGNCKLTFCDPDAEPLNEVRLKEPLILRKEPVNFPPLPFLIPWPLPSIRDLVPQHQRKI